MHQDILHKVHFKINSLRKMNPEIAARIVVLHINEVLNTKISEDDFTIGLFDLIVPKFEFHDCVYDSISLDCKYIDIKILFKTGVANEELLMSISGQRTGEVSFPYLISIKYQARNLNRNPGFTFTQDALHHGENIPKNRILGSNIAIANGNQILLGFEYKNIKGGLPRIMGDFIETLFFKTFLGRRKNSFDNLEKIDPRKKDFVDNGPFYFNRDSCKKLIKDFYETLTDKDGYNRN